jgi:membrane protein DedA with SNARE-associated domain
VPVLFGLLLAMEAGAPVPVPADLVILLLGERVSAGAVPLWLALVILELVAVAGTAVLFLLARGPAAAVLERAGPRVGLTGARRLARAAALVVGLAWLLRRRRGAGRGLAEGCCPACLAAAALAARRLR